MSVAGIGGFGGAAAVAPAATGMVAPAQTAATELDKNLLAEILLKKHHPGVEPITLNVVTPTSAANSPVSSGLLGTKINTSA